MKTNLSRLVLIPAVSLKYWEKRVAVGVVNGDFVESRMRL